ncbi:MAG: hypothetical protein A2710_18175 [Burkholderiales bacterium RIFCSPHIGHO2_01_FULL_64_960]|nr:MAG: hypothetical protein A2710_18175 [Burkholderiales bacterium RIFCSPHIGHO2_01_FULL_64_960]
MFLYLTCEVPVTFSATFVMRREAALLRNYQYAITSLETVVDALEEIDVGEQQRHRDTPWWGGVYVQTSSRDGSGLRSAGRWRRLFVTVVPMQVRLVVDVRE